MTSWLLRVFASAVVRRLAFVLVALLLAWCGIGKAHAADSCVPQSGSNGWSCQWKDDAYDRAALGIDKTGANALSYCQSRSGIGPNPTFQMIEPILNGTSEWSSRVDCYNASGTKWVAGAVFFHASFVTPWCPAGSTWQESTKNCFKPEECLAHNAEPGFLNVGEVAVTSLNQCIGGCEYKSVGPATCTSVAGVAGTTVCNADMDFTGNPCSTPTRTVTQAATDKDKKQECIPLPNGQTACRKPNGEQCYNASTGKQICWMPGETGIKNSDNTQQKRDAGNTPITPNLNLPNGDTLTQTGNPVTTTETKTNNGTTTGTTVTTTTNYVTDNGTNPGGTNDDGEPGDGTGGGSGEGEGEENGASGGGTCAQPPVTSGDPLLGMIATQTWKVRCAILGSGVSSTGNIDDCASPYNVQATDPEAVRSVEILRSLRKQNCPDETPPAESSYMGEEGSKEGLFAGEGEDPPGSDGLDESGFGYGSTCPAIPSATVYGYTIQFDELGVFCDWFHLGGWFVIAITGILCIRGFGGVV